MTRNTTKAIVSALITGMVASLCATHAAAWGPRTERSIAAMAMQVIQRDHPNVFTPKGANYANDAFRGANDGVSVLQDRPLLTDSERVKAIDEEIQLLRDVRAYEPTSYFAYRMGVLSTLIANVMMPFGFPENNTEQNLLQQVNRDTEKHIEQFHIKPGMGPLKYIGDAKQYFLNVRPFRAENEVIIADDYARGQGYDGFLANAAPEYFQRTVKAVADAWHTVLEAEPVIPKLPTNRPTLTEYFVNEVDYLLNVRDNYYQANKVYPHFEEVNPDLPEAYNRLGDLYYEYGQAKNNEDSINRGVREWQIAHSLGGRLHNEIAQKLSAHYISVGKLHLQKGQQKGASNEELPEAMHSLQLALQYDPANGSAPNLIEETQRATKERQERLDANLSILAKAGEIQAQAEKQQKNGDFANAIDTMNVALSFYEKVDDHFTDLYDTAKGSISNIQSAITSIVGSIEDDATDAIDNGNSARDEKRYDLAISEYEKVPNILAAIPEGVSDKVKEETLKIADDLIRETKAEKVAYEARQQQLANQPPPAQ